MEFKWDRLKNECLKRQRGISFEDIVDAITSGGLLRTLDHHNTVDYAGQKILIVVVNDYTYQVPCVLKNDELFMKTIFPSRKYKKFI